MAEMMAELFTIGNLFTLGMLIFLQAVLGFDNLLYISLESKRVDADKQASVRKTGIILAIALRIILLVVVVKAIAYFQKPFLSIHQSGIIDADFNVHSFIVLLGGIFIIYTALKEITHMLGVDDLHHESDGKAKHTPAVAIFWIALMNLVFSFDSILSAIALTDNVIIMSIAIVGSGILMIVMADKVSEFLEKNRLYEVLGLFILFIVGIMLLSEGGHLAHLKLFGYPIEAMSKSTFYFVIAVLVIVDVCQSRYQKKLIASFKDGNSAKSV